MGWKAKYRNEAAKIETALTRHLYTNKQCLLAKHIEGYDCNVHPELRLRVKCWEQMVKRSVMFPGTT